MLSLRLLAREWTAGELRLLTFALALAVAIVVGVSAFTAQLKMAIDKESHRFIAADRVLVASRPAPEHWIDVAGDYSLATGETVSFNSMLMAGKTMQLTRVKAVSASYPLRGKLEIMKSTGKRPQGQSQTIDHGPPGGHIWIDQRLMTLLDLRIGDDINVGELTLRVGAILLTEPDRGGAFFDFAPHALMALSDLPATHIIQPGSRIRYRYLFAGTEKQLAAYHRWLSGQLAADYRWLNIRETQPRVAQALERAERFMLLASTLGVALAGIAIAISARRYSERHFDSMAIMKCLGGSERQLFSLYLQQILLIGLIGFTLGALLGWILQGGLSILLAQYVSEGLAVPGLRPLALGALTAAVCLTAFALPPLMSLRKVPPLRVLRRDLGGQGRRGLSAFLAGITSMTLLMWFHSGNLQLTLSIVLGAAVTLSSGGLLVLWLLTWIRRHYHRAGGALRLAMASLQRHPTRNALQVVMFSFSMMLLLVLVFVRTTLLEDWQRQLPSGTPNHFLVNIQPGQLDEIRDWLGVRKIDSGGFYPIVRGRMTAINGTAINERQSRKKNHNEVQDRALNLTWARQLPDDNVISDGAWWHDGEVSTQLEVSVESHLAAELEIELGDTLRFQIGPESLEATVTSLRKVNWDNMRPNFYMIFPPQVLQGYAHTYITSIYLSPELHSGLYHFIQLFPTVSVIAMDAIIEQIRTVIRQVTQAIELVLWLILSCALLVLLSGIQSSIDIRIQENALLRALGARRQLITGSLWLEFASIGLLAGATAAFAAEFAVWYFQTNVMDMRYSPHPWIWVAGPVVGTLLIGTAGFMSCRHLVRVPPMRLLQNQ